MKAPTPRAIAFCAAPARAEEVDKVTEKTVEFSYSLQSLWPLNYENSMKQTPLVKEGLQYAVDNDGATFYGEETIGDQKYLVKIAGMVMRRRV